MKTAEINESLVGRRVEGVFTGLQVTGTIVGIVTDYSAPYRNTGEICAKGVRIQLDRPVRWGDDFYTTYESTARVFDDWGNLKYTKLIDEPTPEEIEEAYLEAAYHGWSGSGGCRD